MAGQRAKDKRMVGLAMKRAMVDLIDAEARAQDRDRTYIIIKAVAEYLERRTPDPVPQVISDALAKR